MSVRIRLQRRGSKKKPFYRMVVADIESPRDGRFLEIVGTYNPLTEPATITLKEDKIKGWLSKGAKASKTVREILKREGVTVNKEGRKFLALVYWLLAREILKARGDIKTDEEFQLTVEDFETTI